MLQSPSVNRHTIAAVNSWDALFAIVIHLLVVAVALFFTWWQSTQSKPDVALQRIEVKMISEKALKQWQKRLKPPTPPRHQHKQAAPKPKPVVKIKPTLPPEHKITPKAHPKAAVKRTPTAQKKVKKVVEDPNYDPFAPIQSSSDVKQKKQPKAKPDIATLMEQQLSQKEIEQYISMMQSSVQRHWKVPGGIADNIPDPLVEMILQPNGQLVSVRILESSGDATFDQTLIAAIHAAAPFQVPSEQFESFRKNQIRFHPLSNRP